ncbi:hypothetical protein ARMGADRAFT_1038459 [Armillaria gallica]|uniref:Uncharacterized protein n=1 Tax=Armillaria gallica TaxID=47427 RepID=A0A2H3D5D0_ARMGA|nr:hypothetical protein ARMGADRAFT_1038459 [Armillaria gallica]
MERLEGETDLTAAFPNVENGVGWKQGRRGGDQDRVATHDDQASWVLAYAPQWSITNLAHVVIVAVVSLVVIVIVAIVWKLCTAAIGTDVNARGTGWIGMRMGVRFVAMAAISCCCHLHGWINHSTASTEGLCRGWEQDMRIQSSWGHQMHGNKLKSNQKHRGKARQWSKGDKELHSHLIAARLVRPQQLSVQIKYLQKEHKKSCSKDKTISPEVQVLPTKKKRTNTKTTDSVKATKPTGELAKNWEKKRSEKGPKNAEKKDAMNKENDSLVRAGSMVEDDKDIKPEFVDIVKTKGSSIDCKPVGAMDGIRIVKKEEPLIMTARQVGQSVTSWAPLSVKDVQEALDIEFGRTEYCMAERGAWMGLANYQITNFCHDICTEAEKAVEAFIKEHSDQLSTPELIEQYMAYLITPTSPGGNIGSSPPFMQNFDDVMEEFALNPAECAKYGKDTWKKSVKTKHVSVYQATLDSWDDAKSDPPDADSDKDLGDCEESVGTADELAEEDDVAGSVTVTTTLTMPRDVDDADGLSDSESVMTVD